MAQNRTTEYVGYILVDISNLRNKKINLGISSEVILISLYG